MTTALLPADLKPLKNASARLLDTANIDAMQKALEVEGDTFTIHRTRETVTAFHTKTRQVVLRALSKSGDAQGPWITRTHRNLFA